MKTRAAVLHEFNAPLVIEELDLDGPQPGEVTVKVAATGICHSNYHGMAGSWSFTRLPMIPGDEGSGTVVEVGDGVTSLQPGDPVVLSWTPYCRSCFYCNRGNFNLCRNATAATRFSKNGEPINIFGTMSSFAEYTVVPESAAVPVRRDVPLIEAALVGCAVPTGWGAVVNTAGVEPGSSVAVMGLGGVGLSAVMGAVTVNAGMVIGVDINASKLEMAGEFGVTHTVNGNEEDVVARIQELTGGRGVDYAFDAIGLPEVTANAFQAIRPGGTAVVVGMNSDTATLTVPFSLFGSERTMKGCNYGSIQPHADIPRIIDLYMAGRLPIDKLITRRYPLEGINDAFEALLSGEVARSIVEF